MGHFGTMKTDLTLLEAFSLLAIDQARSGRLHSDAYQHTLGGLIAAELYLLDRFRMTGSLIKKAELIDDSDTGNAVLNEAIAIQKQERGAPSVGRIIQAFGRHKPCCRGGAESLVDRGILSATPIKVFWFFQATSYSIVDTALLQELKSELERAILVDAGQVSPKLGTFLLFLSQTDLLPDLFEKTFLKANKSRLKALGKAQAFANEALAKDMLNIRGAMNRVAAKDGGGDGGGDGGD